MQANIDYREILKTLLEERCRKNPRYSQRAFGRDLGIRSSRLSEILNGKVGLSTNKAKQIAQRLGYNSEETEYFLDMVESQHARSKTQRELAKARLRKHRPEYRQLNEDLFRLIADWYHLAILEVLSMDQAESTSKWIAKALHISEVKVKAAVERMLRLKLIVKEGEQLKRAQPFVASTDGVPSHSVRQFHDQILAKAHQSLLSDPIEQRDFSAITMAIDKSKIDQVRKRIKEFRRSLDQELTASDKKDAVYCLSIQFFELTKL